MTGRVVEISETGKHLSVSRGFLVVTAEKQELDRVPLADILVLVISGVGNSLSTNVVNSLLENDVSIIFCGPNYHPLGLVWPLGSHHLPVQRLNLQISASNPLKKRLWQRLVQAKISNQAAVLDYFGAPDPALAGLAKRVGSGDPENCEAQAARRYWGLLMGPDFRRNTQGDGINSLLNYGYAVLRAATARAVAIVGLYPALGIHHHNQANPFCLVDDLMEPFRPLVDVYVKKIHDRGVAEVTPDSKRELAGILNLDLTSHLGGSPLSNCLLRLAQSLVKSFESGKPELVLPLSPLPIEIEAED